MESKRMERIKKKSKDLLAGTAAYLILACMGGGWIHVAIQQISF